MDATNKAVRAALEKAVTQNECDMLLTGEECRAMRKLLAAATQPQAVAVSAPSDETATLLNQNGKWEASPCGMYMRAAPQPVAESVAHDLFTNEDKHRPDVICDRNGQVVLGLCKKCGKGERELVEPCTALHAAALQPVARLTDTEILACLASITHEPPERLPLGWSMFARAIEAHITGKVGATGESK